MAILVTNGANVPLNDLRQHLASQLQSGGQVTCLIVMCFNEQQRLSRVDVPLSLQGQHNRLDVSESAATTKCHTSLTSHMS